MSRGLSREITDKLFQANFDKIINYIFDMCELIVADYSKKQINLPNDENKIRSILLKEYVSKNKNDYGMDGYKFDEEVPEHYDGNGKYIGRVDIRIILKSDFEKDDAYYIIECKRIDGTAELNKKYVKEGIARFVTRKYSSYYGRNIMLGFVVKRISISENAKLIEEIQNNDMNQYMHGDFQFVRSVGITESYRCTYQMQSGKMELRHIFSDYSSVM